MADAIAEGILLAGLYVFLGCMAFYVLWIVVNWAWIVFGPSGKPKWRKRSDGSAEFY